MGLMILYRVAYQLQNKRYLGCRIFAVELREASPFPSQGGVMRTSRELHRPLPWRTTKSGVRMHNI